jgi:hypothetical protein
LWYVVLMNEYKRAIWFLILLKLLFKYMADNQKYTGNNKKAGKSNKLKFTFTEVFMNVLGPSMFALLSSSVVLVYLDLDPLAVLLIDTEGLLDHPAILLIRHIIQFLGHVECMTTMGQIHLISISLVLHSKSIFDHLEYFVPSVPVPAAALETCSKKSIPSKAKNNLKAAPNHQRMFGQCSHLALYSLSSYFNTVVSQNVTWTVAFMVLPGFILDVAANYIVLKMYGEVSIYVYLIGLIVSVTVGIIMAYELPQSGKMHSSSCKLLRTWKSRCLRGRRAYRIRKIRSFRPVGFNMLGLFVFKEGTVTTYGMALTEYTINSILSF